MDNKTNKHSARDIRSKHRSPKRRLSRSSKSTRSQDGESNSVSTSILKEQSTAETINMVEEPVHCRETLTSMFFDALLEDSIAEKKFAKQMDPNNLTTVLSDSLTTSQASTLESGVSTLESDPTKGNSNTNSSMIVENSSGMSCASDCMCCWKIIFKNGNIYKGQTNGNLMHGNGTFFWSNGCVYKGQFKNGYPSGRGEMVLPDLSVYDGEFCLGFFHGKGVLNINSTPIFYNGEWNTGQRSGKGWMVYDQNNWYDGEFINDMRHGYGFRQFKDGTKYKGSWSNDKINGEGCMIWNNNDYYVGKWSDGYQDGYGEYVWNLVPQNSFSFVNYNWYKGNWITGMRSGAGIMNFGYDNGARLAGTWEYNKKHGPGVIFCGNGITVEKDPLFLDDKPCTYTKNQTDTVEESSEKNFSTTNSKSDFRTPTQIYKDISQQINTKENLSSLSKGSISNILRSSINIKTGQYLKLLQTNTGNEPPLKIPIHNIIEEVDLTYFVDNILKKCLYVNTSEISEIDLSLVKQSPGNIPVSLSYINYLPSNQEFVTDPLESSMSLSTILDMTDLKNVIIIYLPQLRNIYRAYAKLGSGEEELNCEPILVRLFLWQLYRDIGLTEKGGLPIVEIDEILIRNPKSCLESTHNPWEPIYFWQFLQAIVCVFCLMYLNMNAEITTLDRFLYHTFKGFLDTNVFPKAGNIQGNCLTHFKDLVPIASMYGLYKEIGEPHSVEMLLHHTCIHKGYKIPCYKLINDDNATNEYAIQIGKNMVTLNNKVYFREKTRIAKQYTENKFENKSLYTFNTLGRRRILKTISKVCPQIVTETKRYCLNYKLSFIEFYEIILLLSYEKVEQNRSDIQTEAHSKRPTGILESSKSVSKDLPKSLQIDRAITKKKKNKK